MIDIEKLPKNLGKKIRIERIKQEISQENLAYNAGIGISTLSKMERGESYPTLDTIAKVANALDIHHTEIFNFNF